MPLRVFQVLPAITLLVMGVANAQSSESSTERADTAAQVTGTLPPGWTARPDEGGDPRNIQFAVMEPGYHLTLGPATILYRTTDRTDGPFHTLATFHQTKKPRHAEGYGLFVGGQALTEKDQRYTYFLVRGDGTYLIKQRKGDATAEVTKGWVPSGAVKKQDAQGQATNLLEIDAKRDPQKVDFKVNGQTVYSTPASRIDLSGIVGVRANHRLDIHFEGFAVHQ
jgi:hypothetical protein